MRRWLPLEPVPLPKLQCSVVNSLDWTVIRTAATAGLLVIVPGAFLSSVVFSDPPAGLAWVFFTLVLAGFGVAGYVAGRLRPDTPMLHGAISAVLAFVVAQVFGMILTFSRGGSIVWVAIPLTVLLAASFGIAGGLASDLVHRRALRTS